jgi:hypothetical protein
MRHLVLAAVVLSAGACCYDPSDACVVPRGSREVCHDIDVREPCGDNPVLPPLSTCGGAFHTWTDCADLGFTVRCGAYSVRPGDPC